MDSVSDAALRCGAEMVVHAYRDGTAPGLARVQELGIDAGGVPGGRTSEDVALLLADDKGAALIVAVGTHATLVEFLDKGRAGMASTFLTRLRVGGKLVDAKGVSRLYRSRIPVRTLDPAGAATAVAFVVALYVTPGGALYREYFAPTGITSPDWVRRTAVMIDFRYHIVSIIAVSWRWPSGCSWVVRRCRAESSTT